MGENFDKKNVDLGKIFSEEDKISKERILRYNSELISILRKNIPLKEETSIEEVKIRKISIFKRIWRKFQRKGKHFLWRIINKIFGIK